MLRCLRAAPACRFHPTVKDWQQHFLKAEEKIQGIVVTAAQEVYVGLHSGTILR
jgi:putative component of membrane protein insertase Oxa1/YidC/SpoIIIJ protein YidD